MKVADGCGYLYKNRVQDRATLDDAIIKFLNFSGGPAFLEVQVNKGSRKDLGRPTTSPKQNKDAFMRFVQS